MSAEHEGVAGSLLAELEAGGELVDEGGFSIDGEQARHKLQSFQVADPRVYALLLVEAAVLAGIERVELRSAGGLQVELGPVAISAIELEHLFAAAFVDLRDADEVERTRRRVLQKLAFACNIALKLEPREIRIEVAPPDRPEELLRLRLRPGDPRPQLELGPRPADRAAGVTVTVDRGLVTTLDELALVRERCVYSRHSIAIDGQVVSRGWARALHVDVGLDKGELGFTNSNARGLKPLRDPDGREIGVVGFKLASREAARALLLTHGVLVEDLRLGSELAGDEGEGEGEWERGFVAVAELDLPKDLGQTQLQHGIERGAVLAAIRAAHDRAAAKRRRSKPGKPASSSRDRPGDAFTNFSGELFEPDPPGYSPASPSSTPSIELPGAAAAKLVILIACAVVVIAAGTSGSDYVGAIALVTLALGAAALWIVAHLGK